MEDKDNKLETLLILIGGLVTAIFLVCAEKAKADEDIYYIDWEQKYYKDNCHIEKIDGELKRLCFIGYDKALNAYDKDLAIYIEHDLFQVLHTSLKGRLFIKKHEGYEPCVYADKANHNTIGWGHKIISSNKLKSNSCINKVQAQKYFDEDIIIAEKAVRDNLKVEVNQSQFDALVSFTFNVGSTAFKKSTLLKYVNAEKYNLARIEFERWVYVTKHKKKIKSQGLLNRRLAEAKLFAYNN